MVRCHLLRGELDAAEQIYNQALAECAALGWQDVPVCGMLHLGLGELAYETNELVTAVLHLKKGIEMTRVGQMANILLHGDECCWLKHSLRCNKR
ncbi:MAG: hypothetical protein IPG70_15415 [Moraxellaceae bacterium]|nr:hypothetical protein [Moraxellaceae bacterium]